MLRRLRKYCVVCIAIYLRIAKLWDLNFPDYIKCLQFQQKKVTNS